jgi:hypothetical protein
MAQTLDGSDPCREPGLRKKLHSKLIHRRPRGKALVASTAD